VGVIGAGTFFRSVHLPNLRRRTDVHLKWIATRTGASGAKLASREQIPMATTDAQDVLNDPDVSAVIIATRHDLHARLAIEAARAGKHVFVEKPLGLSVAECDRVVQAVAEAGVVLGVGFNRRMAPLAIKAKAAFASVREPKTLLYRINAGVLPAGHWLLNDAEGGGRLFGEGVHFLDFARWMFDAQPVSVAAAALEREGTGIDLDNTSVVMTFADGSVATIVYTGQGAASLPKERVEIFGGGETVVIDDFMRLERHGSRTGGAREERLRRMDKGHAALLDNFVDAIAGRVPVAASADDGYWATWCAEEALRRLGARGSHAPGPNRG
jgi:predicted dehydrogenase